MNLNSKTASVAKSAQISAVITRADGTKEYLGTVAYWHRNPLKRMAWNIKQLFKKWSI